MVLLPLGTSAHLAAIGSAFRHVPSVGKAGKGKNERICPTPWAGWSSLLCKPLGEGGDCQFQFHMDGIMLDERGSESFIGVILCSRTRPPAVKVEFKLELSMVFVRSSYRPNAYRLGSRGADSSLTVNENITWLTLPGGTPVALFRPALEVWMESKEPSTFWLAVGTLAGALGICLSRQGGIANAGPSGTGKIGTLGPLPRPEFRALLCAASIRMANCPLNRLAGWPVRNLRSALCAFGPTELRFHVFDTLGWISL
ncbi:hypothetical protein BO99DRAFT_102972 [Aspergillus violaceofuscus CBS 115571]|uniref:Uncharacterized protein n=1 Tax=Aspergillus violaceofuscus (strain CBS 115571) TaxID=1450538 RepID=A0A2V5H957_ASPV1|nr:hypothetical protein BO99DRAFT_102972 [Aspergillus violaceofuscus CBS 115571]